MMGVRLQNKKRELILSVYLSQGYLAAKQLAIDSGITPYHISKIARQCGNSINRAKLERAANAINGMLAEFRIGREDLCHSRFREHIAKRRVAIKRLHAMGLGYVCIASAMKINESTVRYWLKPDHRLRSKANSRATYARRANQEVSIIDVAPNEAAREVA